MTQEHLAYQYKIESKGILFAAGTLVADGDAGPRGVGVIVVRAESFDHARSIAEADPFHKRKLKRYTLHRWIVNEGGITLRVKFSDSSVEID